ncbi:hypothetical protein NVV93_07375 [Pseudomonas sp. LS44]|uniref:hypothetical protein n=1 Tax=Pseudomonas sp. LS44 TaxID=1357074 RepID=UPI00215A8F8E|nr:hypothetical protein [Pseudomonas sp. LS44]UVE19187.1 hypothetical protein NVV93_07375 [Pseudomonas sp. LS44]
MGSRKGLALVGMLLLSMSWPVAAEYGEADRIQVLRSESFRVISSLLLGYDALAGTLAGEQLGVSQGSLEKMTAALRDPALQELQDAYAAFVTALNELEAEPRHAAPMTVNRLLTAQAALLGAADRLYARLTPGEAPLKRRLHALSLASGQVLILHQMRPYGGLVVYPGLPLNEEMLASLDAQINAGLEQLAAEGVQPAEVDSLRRRYRFVRPKLFEARKELAGYGVDRYLGQNMARLDALAEPL